MNRKEFGALAEGSASKLLISKGFKILERNFRCKLGELDIIAEKDGALFFVEVKAKKGIGFGSPLEAVTFKKQRQIVKVAKYYIMQGKKERACHFSVIGITYNPDGEEKIQFIPDAFWTT